MLFLLDGYNVTKGDPATRDLTLESQREALIARLRARGKDLLGTGKIVVVFDGDVGQAARQSDTYPVEVEFSRGQSADDAIVRVASRMPKEQVCLVTSDRGLQERAQAHLGARLKVLGRETLYDAAQRRTGAKSRRDGSADDDEGSMPKGANRITEELKKIWLEEEAE